jgi:hypothetical protein
MHSQYARHSSDAPPVVPSPVDPVEPPSLVLVSLEVDPVMPFEVDPDGAVAVVVSAVVPSAVVSLAVPPLVVCHAIVVPSVAPVVTAPVVGAPVLVSEAVTSLVLPPSLMLPSGGLHAAEITTSPPRNHPELAEANVRSRALATRGRGGGAEIGVGPLGTRSSEECGGKAGIRRTIQVMVATVASWVRRRERMRPSVAFTRVVFVERR